ncbi:hypothetical protein ACLI2R_15440, partial [Enterococcus faecalis]|uniref:hypothetical protein n=1 Tax=Enterococcus faecalis TaxID=1351 RepID=UPI0039855D29
TYDATFAVIRIVLIGFFMLGLLYLERIKLMERITLPKTSVLKWFLPLSVLVLAATGFGLAAPKSEPAWPDPVPFLKKITHQDRVSAGFYMAGNRAYVFPCGNEGHVYRKRLD